MMHKKRFGLIGRSLSHSLSPQIHALLGDYEYRLYPLEPGEVENFVRNGDLAGFNITIPYKQDVIALCDTLTERAERIGAVNTMVRDEAGRWRGDNTDYDGFRLMVEESGISLTGKRALVLGNGGASKTVQVVLRDMGAQVTVVSRSGPVTYEDLGDYADAALIVNATPVGTYPDLQKSPLPSLDGFPVLEGVLDLIYNPASTALMQLAQARGILAMNGLKMLVKQAEVAAEQFAGVRAGADAVEKISRTIAAGFENIVLIGMPGAGKTTIGRELAKALGREFVDLDEYILASTGRSPSEWIESEGEAVFRDTESRALLEVVARHGIVIATGGGTILREENVRLMKQNGRIVWLERALSELSSRGRPLSKKLGVEALYEQREPRYRAAADLRVSVSGQARATAAEIVCRLGAAEA